MLFTDDDGVVYTTVDLIKIYEKRKKDKAYVKGKEHIYKDFNTFLYYNLFTNDGDLLQKGEE